MSATVLDRVPVSLSRRPLAGDHLVRLLPVAALAAFVLLQIALYPAAIGIKDESAYLGMAYVLRAGTLFGDVAHIPMLFGGPFGGHVVSQYPPGESMLLIPFTLLNWHLVFLLDLTCQVIGFVLFGRLLSRLGIASYWSILYLFFPALVLFSRTVMAEVPSTMLVVAALLLYLGGTRGRLGAGALLGLALCFRYTTVTLFGLLLLCALLRDAGAIRRRAAAGWEGAREQMRWQTLRAPPLVLGFVPVFMLFALYNLAAYGHPTTPGYTSAGVLSLGHIVPHLRFYIPDLLLIYPLMLLGPLLYRGGLRLEVVVLSYGMLLFMASYYSLEIKHNMAENLLVGARLLLPAISLYLLAYARMLDRLLARLPSPARFGAATVIGICCLLAAGVTSLQHERLLHKAANARGLIYQHTAPNSFLLVNDEAGKFISPAWGNRQYAPITFNGLPLKPRIPAGVRTLSVVVATQGDDTHSPDLVTARRVAAQLHLRPALDRTVGWHIVIWTSSQSTHADWSRNSSTAR